MFYAQAVLYGGFCLHFGYGSIQVRQGLLYG